MAPSLFTICSRFLLVVTWIYLAADHSTIVSCTVVIRDARYGLWQNPTQILYRMDAGYTPQEISIIEQAMAQISSDMSGCIRFQPGAYIGIDHLHIGKSLSLTATIPGPEPTCISYLGRLLRQAGQGQNLAMFGGPNGCLDTVRDAMKFFLHALNLRNEYNRPDRDQFIQVAQANVRPDIRGLDHMFQMYNPATTETFGTPFDYNSVTIPSPTKYAIPGTVIFKAIGGQSFGSLPRLSYGDCTGLARQYAGCNAALCAHLNPYSYFPTTSAPVITPLTTTIPTTTSPTTTPATTPTTAPTTSIPIPTTTATTTLPTTTSTTRTSTTPTSGPPTTFVPFEPPFPELGLE